MHCYNTVEAVAELKHITQEERCVQRIKNGNAYRGLDSPGVLSLRVSKPASREDEWHFHTAEEAKQLSLGLLKQNQLFCGLEVNVKGKASLEAKSHG